MPVPSNQLPIYWTKPESAPVDQFYGNEGTSKICARFIALLFSCPNIPFATSRLAQLKVIPSLAHFVAYALHRTRLHSSVTFGALYLLARLKGRFTRVQGLNGHALFLLAFMIASKTLCDGSSMNKSWWHVGQGLFSLRDLHSMEREMCARLDWRLTIKAEDLLDFRSIVSKLDGSCLAAVADSAVVPAARLLACPLEPQNSSNTMLVNFNPAPHGRLARWAMWPSTLPAASLPMLRGAINQQSPCSNITRIRASFTSRVVSSAYETLHPRPSPCGSSHLRICGAPVDASAVPGLYGSKPQDVYRSAIAAQKFPSISATSSSKRPSFSHATPGIDSLSGSSWAQDSTNPSNPRASMVAQENRKNTVGSRQLELKASCIEKAS